MKIENNHAHKYGYLCFRLWNFAQLEIQYKKLFQDISQTCVVELMNSQEYHLKSMKVYINRRFYSSTNITYGTIENLHPQTPGIIVSTSLFTFCKQENPTFISTAGKFS